MEQITGLIYRAFDSEGKSYVGQTVKGLEERKRSHWKSRNNGSKFHNALLEKEFKWEILEDNIPEEKLLERERYCAEYFNVCENGYNGKGVWCWPRNAEITEETRKKLSESHKGKKLSEEHKQNISEAIQGDKNPFKGKHHSEETCKKISAKKTGRHWKFVNGRQTYY